MSITYNNYNEGHPWYYKLGGEISSLKAIMIKARIKALHEYRATKNGIDVILPYGIDKALKLKDPIKRKDALLRERDAILKGLWKRDIPSFRKYRKKLSKYRKFGPNNSEPDKRPWEDLALKHNHLSWYWRNLWFIKLMLDDTPQQDLFGFGV